MKQFYRLLCMLFVLGLISSSLFAQQSNNQPLLPDRDGSPPTVTNLNPDDGATGVATNTDLTFTIADVDNVDISSVEVTVSSLDGDQVFNENSGNFFYSGTSSSYSVTITPDDFRAGETVTVSIEAADEADPVNSNSGSPFTYSFDTVPDTQAPYSGGFVPSNDQTSVAVDTNISFHIYDSGIGVDIESVEVTVSSELWNGDPGTYNGATFTSTDAEFSYSGTYDDYLVTIDLPTDFDTAGEEVYWTIDAQDIDPTPLDAVDNFNVMPTVHKHFTIISETRPPEIRETNPADGATNIARNSNIYFEVYDEFQLENNVDLSSVEVNISRDGGAPVSYDYLSQNFSVVENTYGYSITIDPIENFGYDDLVSVTIDAQDLSNPPNQMVQESYSFRVKDDVTPPSISNVLPADTDTNVDYDTVLQFTLTDPDNTDFPDDGYGVDQSTLSVQITENLSATTTTYANGSNWANVTLDGDSQELNVTINPVDSFDWEDDIDVVLTVDDLGGNTLNYSYSFTVQTQDNVEPFVWNLSPADASTNVSISTDIDFYILDESSGVDQSTIVFEVEGTQIDAADYTIQAVSLFQGNGFRITYQPDTNFDYEQVVNLRMVADDTFSTPNSMDVSYSFTCASNQAPVISLPNSFSLQEDVNSDEINFAAYLSDTETPTNELILTAGPTTNITVDIDGLGVQFIPDANWFGTETITFFVNDTLTRAQSSDTVDIVVAPVDDAPYVANPIADVSVAEDAPDSDIDLTNVFNDIDSVNEDIIYTVYNNTNSSLVATSIAGNILQLDFLDDQNGTADITVRAESDGKVVNDVFNVTVTPVDDAPYVANPISDFSVDEDAAPSNIDLSNVFDDIDNDNSAINYVVQDNSNSGLTTVDISGTDLEISYTENGFGSSTITIRAESNGENVTDVFEVTVNSVDDAPEVANPIADVNMTEDEIPFVIDLTATFTDLDNNDANITKSVQSNSNEDLASAVIVANELTITLVEDQSGTAEIVVAGLSNGQTVTDSFTLTVAAENDAPEINITDTFDFDEDQSLVVNFAQYISDIDGDDLTLSATNSANIFASIDGSEVTFTATENWSGTETVQFTVNDLQGRATASDNVDVTVDPINDLPTITLPASFTFNEDGSLVEDFTPYIDDIEDGANLTITYANNNNVNVSVENQTVTFTAQNDWNGSETIQFTVTDSNNDEAIDDVQIIVNAENDAPLIDLPASFTFNEDEDLTVDFSEYTSDVDEDDLILSVIESDNISAAISGMSVTFSSTANWSGTEQLTFTVNDQVLRLTDTDTVDIIVTPVDDAPYVANPIADVNADEDADNIEIDLTNVFDDIDSSADIFKSLLNNTNPSLVAISVINNLLTVNFLDDANGTADITIRGTSEGKTVDNTFTITVAPIDDAPYVAIPIPAVVVDEDSNATEIDLSNVFSDIDNDDAQIFKSVISNNNQQLISTNLIGEILTLNYIENKSGTAVVAVQALSNGKTVTEAIDITVNAVDDAPVIDQPIADITTTEDSTDEIIFLSDLFTDVDNSDSNIIKTVDSNSNPTLVDIEIDGNLMTIDYLDDQYGTAVVVIQGESNGLTVTDQFTITVTPVDDAPYVATAITDVYTEANVPNIEKDLTNVFADIDNDDNAITKTVMNNTNSSLVLTNIIGNTLILSIQENQSGSATITVRGTSNGLWVEDEFQVVVTSDDDGLIVANPIPDQNVDEDASNINIDISDVFEDLADPTANIEKSLQSNSNETLVDVIVSGNTMILDLQENQYGEAVISLKGISNGNVEFDDFILTVEPVNDNPTISLPGSFSFNEDGSLVVDFSIYVDDIDGDDLNLQYSGNTNVFINIAGLTVTFTATEDWANSEAITFVVDDGFGGQNSDIVVVAVNPINDAPVANAGGQYNVVSDDTGFADVDLDGTNSYDIDGTIDSYRWEWNDGLNMVTGAQNTVSFPEGTTEVTLIVTDNEGATDEDIAFINVNSEMNQQPVAYRDTFYVDEDATLIVNAADGVLGNDVDDDFPEALTAVLVGNVQYGSLTFNNDGSFQYSPIQDFSGEDEFTYKAYDGQVYSPVTTVTLVVNPMNDFPTINLPASFSFDEDESVTIDFSDYVNDVDADDVLTLSITNNSNVLYTINNLEVTFSAIQDWNGTDNITVTVDDGNGGFSSDTVDIIVDSVNDRPIANDDSYSIDEDQLLTVNLAEGLLNNDEDIESQNLNAYLSTNVQNGTLTLNQDGSFTYQPNTDYNGTDSFTYFVSDGDMNSLPATVNLFINAVNDAPTLDLPATATFPEDNEYEIDFADYAEDIDGDELSITATGMVNLSYEVNNMIVTIIPNQDWVGNETLTFTVEDPSNETATDAIIFTVTQVNDAPVAITDSYSTEEDQPLVTSLGNSLLLNDLDDDYPSALTAELGQSPSHGSVVLDSDGTFVYNPVDDYFGTDSFTYRVFDGDLYSQYQIVNITISGVNDAPTIDAPDPITFDEDASTTFDFTEFIDDIDGDAMTLSVTNNTNILYEIDGYEITFSALPDWNGSENITVTVSDSQEEDTAIVQILVNPVNDAPISANDSYNASEEVILSVSANDGVLANDTDDDYPEALTAILVNGVSHGELTLNANGSFTYQGQQDYVGDDFFSYKAFDGADYSGITVVTITVGAVNDAPEFSLPANITFAEDAEFMYDFSEYISDSDNSLEDITLIASNYDNINVEITGLIVSLIPDQDWNGVENITFIADDGSANNSSSQASIDIIVTAVNDAPVLVDFADQTMNEDGELIIPIQVSDVDNVTNELLITSSATDEHVSTSVQGLFLTITTAENWSGQSFIDVFVNDGTGFENSTDSDRFLLTVSPVNDAPEVSANIPDYNVDEDFVQSITMNLDNFFSDIDGDELSYSVDFQDDEIEAAINGDFLSINSEENWNGTTTITVTASDDEPLSVNMSFDVIILAINDAPVLDAIDDAQIDEDTELVYSLTATDVDDTNLTFLATTINSNVDVSVDGNELSAIPDENWNGSAQIVVTVDDGEYSDTESFWLEVNPVNDAPYVSNEIANIIRDEDFAETIVRNLDLNFADVDGDDLNYTVEFDSTMIMAQVEDNLLYLESVLNANGSTTIAITADDGFERSSRVSVTDEFIFTINPINDAPIIELPDSFSFAEDTTGQLDLEDNISDVDEDELMLNAIGSEHIFVDIDGTDCDFIPAENWNGTETITFVVNDQMGRTLAQDNFLVTVTPVNDIPYIVNPIEDITFDEDTEYEGLDLRPVFADFDIVYGDELTYSFAGNDSIAVTIANGMVTLTPNPNWYGEETIEFIATDITGESVTDEVIVTVENVNDEPEIDLTQFEIEFQNGELVFEEGGYYQIDFANYISDIDQDLSDLVVTVNGNTDLIITINGLLVTIEAPQYWAGSEILTFTISDEQTRATVQVTLKVIVEAQFNDERVELEHHTISWQNPTSKFDITSNRSVNEIKGKIFDRKGRLVKALDVNANGNKKIAIWDGRTSDGTDVSGGFYIYQFKVGNKIYQGSIIVAR